MSDNFFSFTIFFNSQRKHFLFVNHLDLHGGCLALTFVFDFCGVYFIALFQNFIHESLLSSFVPLFCSSWFLPYPPLPLQFMTSSSFPFIAAYIQHTESKCCLFIHVFRIDHLRLNNMSGSLSLEKTQSLSQQPLIFCSFSSTGEIL